MDDRDLIDGTTPRNETTGHSIIIGYALHDCVSHSAKIGTMISKGQPATIRFLDTDNNLLFFTCKKGIFASHKSRFIWSCIIN